MSKRNDAHTDLNIIPADYQVLLGYAHGNASEPSYNLDCERPTYVHTPMGGVVIPGRPHEGTSCCVRQVRRSFPVFKGSAAQGASSQCGICGTWFRYGVALRHEPTGEVVFVGHDCAGKYLALREDAALAAYKADMAEKRTAAGRERRLLRAYESFNADNPWFQAAVATARQVPTDEARTRRAWAAPILLDMDARIRRTGQALSEKAESFARKLAEAVTQGPAPEEPKVDAPEGRQVISGTIVSVKVHESAYGTSLKMTVKVDTPDGRWLTWGTVPSNLESEVGFSKWAELKGRKVTFTATVSRSDKDASFSFFKRPAKAELARLELAEAEAEAWAIQVDRDHAGADLYAPVGV